MEKRFLIADDHTIIRKGMTVLLRDNFQNCTCVEANNGCVVIKQLKEQTFDLIILEMNMADVDTLSLIDWINTNNPDARILIFSMHASAHYGIQLYRKGIRGFLNKSCSDDEIVQAINLILSNRIYIPQDLQDVMSDMLRGKKKTENNFELLSDREFSVSQLLAQGKNYEEIARILCIEVSTVRTFKTRIFKKLSVNTTFEFLSLANAHYNIFL
ncbi:response regulator transcription factor [Taibaiella soli]|uniref:DNA-binding response regulator n=1 Tax=Taibaiella soli TaxID=1649169 RepID=A0A2W2ATF4_9BACT|nr:response regulator transcription factor [Taibaiella soli]PZF70988.1 hypothetical protein DN068_19980 [Taibaiella soli]